MTEKSYEIGFSHGNSGKRTSAYKPGQRKVGGQSRAQYDAGFDAGTAAHHEATRLERQQLAWLNLPRATRGPRPE
jgi:hypothetical protein